jgi:hypothetical protein
MSGLQQKPFAAALQYEKPGFARALGLKLPLRGST